MKRTELHTNEENGNYARYVILLADGKYVGRRKNVDTLSSAGIKMFSTREAAEDWCFMLGCITGVWSVHIVAIG